MRRIPTTPDKPRSLSQYEAARDLIGHGRRYRAKEITLTEWADLVRYTLASYESRLAPGGFAVGRSSGSASRQAT
jgi:hypothetical protein